jgi:predicted transcriptional regulator
MAGNVTVTISERLYRRALELARRRQESLTAVIEQALEQGLPADGPVTDTGQMDAEEAAVQRELAAFVDLHPSLKDRYGGHHVAIYEGRLVDHDLDREALYRRIAARYPDRFVWLAPVDDEPLPTLHFRSPRLVGLA